MLIANFGIPALLGWLNGDMLGMLLIAGVGRVVFVHHTTFFINSLAHIWGRQPYTDKNTARDNDILAFFTYGEGYHNYHHIFEYDYRNGIRWWHYDPTKWLIKSLSIIGLAKNLRRCPEERIEKARAMMQLMRMNKKLEIVPNAEELKLKVLHEYEVLTNKITEFYAARKKVIDARKASFLTSYEKLEIDFKYKELKQALALQKQKWLSISELQFQTI